MVLLVSLVVGLATTGTESNLRGLTEVVDSFDLTVLLVGLVVGLAIT